MDYDFRERALKKDVLGIEMETFALFNNAKKFGKNATALLTVSDLFFSDEKLSSEDREEFEVDVNFETNIVRRILRKRFRKFTYIKNK